MSKFRNYWLGLPIGSKMKAFIVLLLLVVLIAAGFNIYTIQFSVGDVNRILEEISQCESAQDAMTNEEAAFQVFVRDPSIENLSALNRYSQRHFPASIRLRGDRRGALCLDMARQERLSELFFTERSYLFEPLRSRYHRTGFRTGVGGSALSGL